MIPRSLVAIVLIFRETIYDISPFDAEIIEECRRLTILKTFEEYRLQKKDLLANLNIKKWAVEGGFVSKS